MPFGNRKIHVRGSFQLSIVTIKKNIAPLETRNVIISAFSKLKTAHFNGKILLISLRLNLIPNISGCYGLIFVDLS